MVGVCIFCEEFEKGSTRIIWQNDRWVLIPGLGSFVEGYVLLMPKRCVPSFSHLAKHELIEAENVLSRIRELVERVYGPTIIAEHGLGRHKADMGAACCNDHAHLHMFPVAHPENVLERYEHVGGKGHKLGALHKLSTSTRAYLYLSPKPREQYVWDWHAGFKKQFVRRVVAELMDEPLWNWRYYGFEDTMQATVLRLKPLFNEH